MGHKYGGCMTVLKTSSKLMFNELKWHSFPTICIYHTHVMIFKPLNNQTPIYVKELLTFYNLRSTIKNSIVKTNQTQSSKVIHLAILEWKHGMNYPNV